MSTPDKNGWIKDMASAPKDEHILACEVSKDGVNVELCVALWDDDEWVDSAGYVITPTHWQRVFLPTGIEETEAA